MPAAMFALRIARSQMVQRQWYKGVHASRQAYPQIVSTQSLINTGKMPAHICGLTCLKASML